MSLLSRIAVEAARAYGMFAKKGGISASYLVVAGGGGGAGGTAGGGGGGAGGFQNSTFSLSALNTYSIVVGAGGNGGAINTVGSQGSNSVISGTGLSTVTSVGGGYGGYNNVAAGSGGSGGGGGGRSTTNRFGGAGTSGQGYAGGDGLNDATNQSGAGGGGASAIGGAASGSSTGGAGGNGSASSISGSSVTYAGGGGGAGYYNTSYGSLSNGGLGGSGGGGTANSAGTVNLGGGGGGGGGSAGGGGAGAGAAGGSGIVIISYASATPLFVGGTLTTSGGNQIHTFTSSGTLSPITPITASYLVVAGGGGGGAGVGGGGGAGGLLTSSTTLYSGATYIVTVGGGGSSGVTNSSAGGNGSNSVLSGTGLTTVTSTGGGGGGTEIGSYAPGNGGSGGGGAGAPGSNRTGGTGTSGQGYAGGNGGAGSPNYGGGGGGGAGAVGAAGTTTTGGNGGVGVTSSISGTSTYYAGGGGSGLYIASGTPGTGGLGGGGDGSEDGTAGIPGTTNLGGGGGGGGTNSSGSARGNGGQGGSGIVIISYAGSQVFNGGLVTTSGGNTIHTFTSTGALTPLTNNLNNSLRFRSSASAYLSRTPTVAGNQQKWTYSLWLKRGTLSTVQNLLVVGTNVTGQQSTQFGLNNDNTIQFFDGLAGVSTSIIFDTTQVFRDPSAWYHIVLAVDTTQATSSNRVKMYVNGNQITAFTSSTYPTQNFNTLINAASIHYIGRFSNVSTNYFDGYLADVNLIDGQQLEPYYFGNNDANGVWKPIQYKGTYGTNGFYLTFGNTTSTTTLGYDSSPNGNNWTCNNISLTAGTTYDAMTDVPTNTSATVANYCVLNPLDSGSGGTISEGNLKYVSLATGYSSCRATIGMTSGKWYWEITVGSTTGGIGIATSSATLTNVTGYDAYGWAYLESGVKYNNNSATSYGATWTTNDVIGVAFDADAGTLVFYKNNSSQGTAFTGLTSGPYFPTASDDSGGSAATLYANFGQRPFTYTPPSGYVALNTYNLPTPTILQGNQYMDATLYTGNGVTQVIVNQAQFKPDLVWTKSRSNTDTNSNTLVNSNAGRASSLSSNQTSAQGTSPSDKDLISFNSNGFTVGPASQANMNTSAWTFVAWQWKAGQGTNTTNTSGSITSTVSVNTTAGFSIVTYTGTGANATVGHGLGVAPKMVIVKRRDSIGDWLVWNSVIAASNAANVLFLNATNAQTANSSNFNSTAPTSTVFSVGTNAATNASGGTHVAYCWAEIAGFSKLGSYTGNGNADGVFVYTGFRPAFVLFKNASAVYSWMIKDNKRANPYNVTDGNLYPDLNVAEDTGSTAYIDLLSNGFKMRGTSALSNGSGNTIIYAAFAENPFKNANAR